MDSGARQLLAGKTAAITGGARGLGRALAQGLAQAGARIVLLDINEELVKQTAAALRELGMDAIGYSVDVRSFASCESVSESLEAAGYLVDFVINGAGINSRDSFVDESALQSWDDIMDVNLNGYVHIAKAFLPHLKKSQGAIVNLASIASFTAGTSSFGYVVSKGAIRSLTQVLARDLAPWGIRVNALAPSMIATDMNTAKRRDKPLMDAYLKRVMLGRVGETSDLVGPTIFLCSDWASYITGVVLPVDGGYLAS